MFTEYKVPKKLSQFEVQIWGTPCPLGFNPRLTLLAQELLPMLSLHPSRKTALQVFTKPLGLEWPY